MRKIMVCAILLLALLAAIPGANAGLPLIGGGSTGGFSQDGSSQYMDEDGLTLMVYMIGSNLESEFGDASTDILEMANSGANFDNINVVIAAGGASSWQELSIQAGEVGFGTIRRSDQSYTGVVWDERRQGSISSVDMLSTFLRYSVETFPAKRYALVLWNHGGGPIVGYGHDEVSDNILSIPQLRQALANSPFATKKLEWIGFDACLMGSFEIACALAPYAEYMIASEESEPGGGWYYGFLGVPEVTMSGFTIGQIICDAYAYSMPEGTPYSLSLIDLGESNKFNQVLKGIFDNSFTDADRVGLAQAAYYSQTFGLVASNSTYDLYDFPGFVENLCQFWGVDDSTAQAVQWMANAAVIYNQTNIPGANGVSFYFPLFTDPSRLGAVELYQTLGLDSHYIEYLKRETGAAMSTGATSGDFRSYDGRSRLTGAVTRSGATFSLQMTDAQREHFVRAEYALFAPAEDGQYDLVRRGGGVTVDEDGRLSAEVSALACRTDADAFVTMAERSREETVIAYFLPASLKRNGETKAGSLQFFLEAGQARVGEFVPDDGTDVPPKQLLTLEPGDRLTLYTQRYRPACDDDGNILPFTQWTMTDLAPRAELEVGEDGAAAVNVGSLVGDDCLIQLVGIDVDDEAFCSPLMPLSGDEDTEEE